LGRAADPWPLLFDVGKGDLEYRLLRIVGHADDPTGPIPPGRLHPHHVARKTDRLFAYRVEVRQFKPVDIVEPRRVAGTSAGVRPGALASCSGSG